MLYEFTRIPFFLKYWHKDLKRKMESDFNTGDRKSVLINALAKGSRFHTAVIKNIGFWHKTLNPHICIWLVFACISLVGNNFVMIQAYMSDNLNLLGKDYLSMQLQNYLCFAALGLVLPMIYDLLNVVSLLFRFRKSANPVWIILHIDCI